MNTKQLKDKILAMAMRGELVEQDPTDESAEVLLEKIKEEKTKLIAEKKIKKEKPLAPIEEDEIPYDLPQGWVWTRLVDIIKVLGDGLHGTPEYTTEGQYFFVNGNNLNNGKVLIKEDTKKITEDTYIKHKKPLTSQTVFVSINGTLGNVAFYNNEQIMLGKSVCYFDLFEDIYKKYIYYCLDSKYFEDYYTKKSTSTTIKNLSLRSMRELPLPLPPLAEQKRIVEKIETLFAEVDKLEESRENLDGLKGKLDKKLLDMAMRGELVEQDPTDESAEILLEKIKEEKAKLIAEKKIKKEKPLAEGDDVPYQLPQGWVWTRLGDIVDSRIGKTPDRKNLDYWGRGYSWVSIADMNNKEYISETKEEITELAYNDVFKNNISKKGTLIMSFKLTIGKTAILEKDAFHNEAITSLVPYLEDSIDKNYLKAILPHFSNLTEQTNAIMGKTLNKEKIRNIKIPLPPFEEQKRIAERLETIRNLISENL